MHVVCLYVACVKLCYRFLWNKTDKSKWSLGLNLGLAHTFFL